jgi:hypothetical protein
MTIYAWSSLLASILCVVVGTVAVVNRKSPSRFQLFQTTYLVGFWSLFPFATTIISESHKQLIIARIAYVVAAPAPYAFMHLTLAVLGAEITRGERIMLWFGRGMSLVFAALALHPLYIQGVGVEHGARFIVPGPLFPAYIAYFLFICTWSFWRMSLEYVRSSGLKRNQIKYFFGSFAVAYIGGGIHFLAAYLGREIFPHDALVALFTIIIGYAILRFRLMDFNLIIRLALAHFVFLLILVLGALPLIALTEWAGSHFLKWQRGFTTVVIVSTSVLVFESLRKRVTRFVDLFIFRSQDFKAILGGFEEVLSNRDGIENFANALATKLMQVYGTDHAGLAVWDYQMSSYRLLPTETFVQKPISRYHETLVKTDFLMRTLETERRLFWHGIVVEDEITELGNRAFPGERTTFWKIRRTMRWLGAHICVPVMIDNDLSAVIVLGRKRTESVYNREDKRFLTHLAELTSNALKEFAFIGKTSTIKMGSKVVLKHIPEGG